MNAEENNLEKGVEIGLEKGLEKGREQEKEEEILTLGGVKRPLCKFWHVSRV